MRFRSGPVSVGMLLFWRYGSRHVFFGTFLRCFSIKIILKSWGAVVSGPIYSKLLVSTSYNAWTVVVMVADWLTSCTLICVGLQSAHIIIIRSLLNGYREI